MHVPKRHAERRVAHKLLNSLRRRALHSEVRAEGVPKHMGSDDPEPSSLAAEPERCLDCGLRERPPIRVAEHSYVAGHFGVTAVQLHTMISLTFFRWARRRHSLI